MVTQPPDQISAPEAPVLPRRPRRVALLGLTAATLVVADSPNGEIPETDHTNNRLVVSIAVGGVARTTASGGTPDIPATLIAIATQTAEAETVTPTPNIPATLIALATQTAEAVSTPLP